MADLEFIKKNTESIQKMSQNQELLKKSQDWYNSVSEYEYSYHFSWMGMPIIQFPQDILAISELIWKVKPDLIIETGIARGGSLVFYASQLELLGGEGKVLGIDIDIRQDNKNQIEKHPMFKRIKMLEGSSVDNSILNEVKTYAENFNTVMVILDSNHTHQHVLDEIKLYSSLVSYNSYLIVMDTVVEYLPEKLCENRPWSKGNNPLTAVNEFLKNNSCFSIDETVTNKLLVTSAPDGFLKRIKND